MNFRDLHNALRPVLIAVALAGLAAGLAAHWAGRGGLATVLWWAGTLPVLAALLVEIVTSLRRGETGLDLIAALSMSAALGFGEPLAAAVVALMYAGGQALESFAERRARSEMTALLSRVPRSAQRHGPRGLEEVPLDAIVPGDRLLIRHGDTLPVDGTVADPRARLDLSALTGESLPVSLVEGAAAMSGAVNAGDPFDLIATRPAADSTFAGIVRLVGEAQAARAPMARMADRYALVFLAATLALAGLAWGLSGDPVRAVAVLVVATPCPLILAVPVALVAGLSRAAGQGILIKGGPALEALAGARVLILDKTGTLTEGRPRLIATRAARLSEDEMLVLAAGLDQASPHPVARALVAEARARGLALSPPERARETPGEGLAGLVGGHAVVLGGRGFVAGTIGALPGDLPDGAAPGEITVALAVDGAWAGELVLADGLRAGTEEMLDALRDGGLTRIVLATGDRVEVAQAVTGGADAGRMPRRTGTCREDRRGHRRTCPRPGDDGRRRGQ